MKSDKPIPHTNLDLKRQAERDRDRRHGPSSGTVTTDRDRIRRWEAENGKKWELY